MTSALPKAVQKQMEAAEALRKQVYEPPQEPAPVEGNTVTPEAPAPTEPTTPPVVQSEQKPPVEDGFEQKYKILQGKYNAEVPRLQAQVREQADQVKKLLDEVTALKTPKAEPPAPPTPEKFLSDEDAEKFGADLVDMAGRAAKQAVAEARREWQTERESLLGTIQKLEDRVGTVDTKISVSDEEKFFSRLDKAVPEWETLNTDQKFLDWLREVDPIYGVPRMAALQDAREKLDASRTIAIFRTFAPAAPAPTPTPAPDLQRQVAPSASRASQPAPANQKIWTGEEYQQAFDHRLEAKIGREAAAQRRAEADLAAMENRVRW